MSDGLEECNKRVCCKVKLKRKKRNEGMYSCQVNKIIVFIIL